jgi:N-acetylglucosamine-6-phosphate deacetylase
VKLGVAAAVIGDTLVSGDLEVADGRIVRYGVSANSRRRTGTAVPGFVDLQVNGFADVDFLRADAEGYRRAGAALLETGVTSYLPTFISAPEPELVAALAEVPGDADGPRVLGAHVEGPFLSPRRRGVHPASALRLPDTALLERLLDAGSVRLVTLAPELPGADALIDLLTARDITVSIGHTEATAAQAHAAFDRGARSVTHIFNAMRPLGHRDPGVVGAALARSDVTVCVILDGYHLAAETAALIWRAAAGRFALTTDAIAAAGLGDGSYSLGETDVQVNGGVARGPSGELAGSALTMIEAVRNLVGIGAPLSEAVNAATAVPAAVIGERSVGRIDAGLPADLVVLDDNLEIEKVLVGGRALVVA